MKKYIFLVATILVILPLSAISTNARFNNLKINRNTNELLNKKAVKLVIPRYSVEARKAKVQGSVLVHVEVNEKGKVTEARTIEGHQLLKDICEKAALASIIKPKFSNGKKIKYSGIIQYTFSIKD